MSSGQVRAWFLEPGPFDLAPWKPVGFCSQISVHVSNLMNPTTRLIRTAYDARNRRKPPVSQPQIQSFYPRISLRVKPLTFSHWMIGDFLLVSSSMK